MNNSFTKSLRGWLQFAVIVVAALLFTPSIANAQAAALSGQVVTPFGTPAQSAKVRVCAITSMGIPCSPLASLFSDFAMTQPLPNPITTDQYGNYKFFLATGTYNIQITLAGASQPTYIYYASAGGSGGGGGNPAPPNFSVQFNNSSAFGGSNNLVTNGAGTIQGQVRNYAQQGDQHTPYVFTQSSNQIFGANDLFSPLNVNGYTNSGTMNTDNFGVENQLAFFQSNNHSPSQAGGSLAVNVANGSPGDNVADERLILGQGNTRGQDEGVELDRKFAAFQAQTFGGTAAISSANSQGNVSFQLTACCNYNFGVSGEEMNFIDFSKKYVSPGNVQNITNWATDASFMEIDGDSSSGLDTKFPTPSTFTTLTDDINNNIHTAGCPNTDTGTGFPNGNAFITDPFGVNIYQGNPSYPSNPSNYCVHVASTSGLTVGTVVYMTDNSEDREYALVSTVPDATHFTANIKHPLSSGASISWGGAVGWAWSSSLDDRAAHTSDSAENEQSAATHLVYPILGNQAGNKLIVDTGTYGLGSPAELLSLATQTNIPTSPLTITATIAGGVITAIASNATSGANYVTSVATLSGVRRFLPPPALTYSCSGTQPVITLMQSISAGSFTYIPTLVSGGTGCTGSGVTVAATSANPFNLYPHAITYRVTDPSCTFSLSNPQACVTDGYMLVEPIATVGQFTNGDQVEEPIWQRRFISNRTSFTGDPIVTRSGQFGIGTFENYAFIQDGQAYKGFVNNTPSSYYYGTYPNWGLSAADPKLVSVIPAPVVENLGVNSGAILQDLPPVASPLLAGSSNFGGSLITVGCTANFQAGIVDHPCLHGRYDPFNIFLINEGGSSQISFLGVNPANSLLSWSGQFKANSLTALNALNAGTLVLGNATNPSVNSHATINFTRDGSTVAANIQICDVFGNLPIIGIGNGTDGCQGTPPTGAQNPSDGTFQAGTLFAAASASFNNVIIARPDPVQVVGQSYSGTAGSISRQINYSIVNSAGQPGRWNPNNFSQINLTAALGGGNSLSVTCPANPQFGMSGGDTYEVFDSIISGGSGVFDLGACPVGTTATFTAEGTSVGQGPDGANSGMTGGSIQVAKNGYLGFDASYYSNFVPVTQITNPTAGVVSFDGATRGDHTATILAAGATFSSSSGLGGGFNGTEGTAPTGAAGVDNLWSDSAAHWLLMINNAGTKLPLGGILHGTTGTITGTALTATCDSGAAPVTGAVAGDTVSVSSTTGADVGGAFYLRASVTSSNTVTVYVCGTGTPSSLAYNVDVHKHP